MIDVVWREGLKRKFRRKWWRSLTNCLQGRRLSTRRSWYEFFSYALLLLSALVLAGCFQTKISNLSKYYTSYSVDTLHSCSIDWTLAGCINHQFCCIRLTCCPLQTTSKCELLCIYFSHTVLQSFGDWCCNMVMTLNMISGIFLFLMYMYVT